VGSSTPVPALHHRFLKYSILEGEEGEVELKRWKNQNETMIVGEISVSLALLQSVLRRC
jgi:hypothetical protein